MLQYEINYKHNVLLVHGFCLPDIAVLWLMIVDTIMFYCTMMCFIPNVVWWSKGSMQIHTHTLKCDELMNYFETDNIDPHTLCLASRWRLGSDIPRRLSYWNAAQVHCCQHCMNCGRTCVSTEFRVVNTNSTPEEPAVTNIVIKVCFNTIEAYTHTLIHLLAIKGTCSMWYKIIPWTILSLATAAAEAAATTTTTTIMWQKYYKQKQTANIDYVHNLMRQWNTSYQEATYWKEERT